MQMKSSNLRAQEPSSLGAAYEPETVENHGRNERVSRWRLTLLVLKPNAFKTRVRTLATHTDTHTHRHTHTDTHTHARTHARTHTHAHTHANTHTHTHTHHR